MSQSEPFKVGEEVIWTDPDGGAKHLYKVHEVPEADENGKVPSDGIYFLVSPEGSECEAFAHEMSRPKPRAQAKKALR